MGTRTRSLMTLAATLLLAGWMVGCTQTDPDEQGRQVMGAIKQGMSWKQVCEIKAPRKYKIMNLVDTPVMGQMTKTLQPGQALKFEAGAFEAGLKAGDMPLGFLFDYNFSARTQFIVVFNKKGKVEEVEKLRTMSDLLQ